MRQSSSSVSTAVWRQWRTYCSWCWHGLFLVHGAEVGLVESLCVSMHCCSGPGYFFMQWCTRCGIRLCPWCLSSAVWILTAGAPLYYQCLLQISSSENGWICSVVSVCVCGWGVWAPLKNVSVCACVCLGAHACVCMCGAHSVVSLGSCSASGGAVVLAHLGLIIGHCLKLSYYPLLHKMGTEPVLCAVQRRNMEMKLACHHSFN